ncbi:AAA family ATPase [Paraoerskovia marina]|uniref:AAA family ATPase n=1 Tax=Paraoerskovia marina TaxID=545619 RepID=UPI0004924F57|nr:AAA family ATPase [Paraoerskovia marina]
MAVDNPFSTTPGAVPPVPPVLVGRDQEVELFTEALDDGPAAPGRWAAVGGPAGIGKSALLAAYAERARARGWAVLAEQCTEGLGDRVTRALATNVLDGGDAPAVGLLITVDALDASRTDELASVVTDVEHLELTGRDVALVVAGRPAHLMTVLGQEEGTLRRRTDVLDVGRVPADEAALALREVVDAHGRTVDDDALERAVAVGAGYPVVMQVLGEQVWNVAQGDRITTADVESALPAVRAALGPALHAPVLAELTDEDTVFLRAMARDDGPSEIASLAARLGESAQGVGVHRRRLTAARVIEPVSGGRVDLAIPYLREFLRA